MDVNTVKLPLHFLRRRRFDPLIHETQNERDSAKEEEGEWHINIVHQAIVIMFIIFLCTNL